MKQGKPILHGRDHAGGGADPIPGLGSFAVGQRKSFTAADNASTACYPFDDFVTSDAAVFTKDVGTGDLSINKTGLYRLDAWSIMYALPASIAASVTASLGFDNGANAAPNTSIDWWYGTATEVPGTLSGGVTNQWQMFATTFLNVGSVPYTISTSINGNGASGNTWSVDWAIFAATRISDVQAFDLSVFGS